MKNVPKISDKNNFENTHLFLSQNLKTITVQF